MLFTLPLLLALVLPALVYPARVAAQESGISGTMETLPAGSLVIAMDNTNQRNGSGVFNLKAYGLIENILWAGIPVKWAIRSGKTVGGTDFTAQVRPAYPTASATVSTLNFGGGPFIVHRDFAAAVAQTINNFNAANSASRVQVYELTQAVTVDVRYTLTHKPKVAVFDDGGSAAIHTAYLAAAGFTLNTHYLTIPAASLANTNANACFTFGSEPHWAGSATLSVTNEAVQSIRQFVGSGGNFLAQCEGILTYENNAAQGRFHTTQGVVDGSGTGTITYPSGDLAYSQFEGTVVDQGGSVDEYAPSALSAFRSGVQVHLQHGGTLAGSNLSQAVKATAARLATGGDGGWIFYLGGHSYSTTASQASINGVRMYLNAVFVPTGRPTGCNLSLAQSLYTVSGTIYEDVNGDASLADGIRRPNVGVRLYADVNNNGVVDTGDTYLAATATDTSGNYSFQVSTEASGSNFLVAVDSKSVTASANFNSGSTQGNVWAEQTYGDDPATASLDLAPRFGGRQADTSDNFNPTSTLVANNAYEHLARVNLAAGNVTNANFGFSFNVVANTRDNGDDDATAARTIQGSLRQFIQNANALSGANAMRFVPAVATNGSGASGAWWQVALTSTLPFIADASTTIDGTAYSNANGTSVRDTNAAISESTTGAELVIDAAAGAALETRAANTIFNLLGVTGANGSGSAGAGLYFNSASVAGSIVRNSAIFGNDTAGVTLRNGATGVQITTNIIRNNLVGIEFDGASGNTVGFNAITANQGDGILVSAGNANTITQNSTYANSDLGIDLGGNGVTVNDAGDADAGANDLQNFPVLDTATVVGNTLTVTGWARPGAIIEFFIAAPDPSGFGEGQTYLATFIEGSPADTDATASSYASPLRGANVGTDTTNRFSFTLSTAAAVPGAPVTATATIAGNTSEFSNSLVIANAPPAVSLVKSVMPDGNQAPGTDLTYTITFANTGGQSAANFRIIDPDPASALRLDANTDFKLGSVANAPGTTGITAAVEYSNDNGATWNYTPASGTGGAPTGYDRTVTHLRWTFGGNLPQTAPDNTGSVSFTVRIR